MTASDYTILATSERYRDVVGFWRRQLADAEDFTGAFGRAAITVNAADLVGPRTTISVTLGARATAALAEIASDDVGRFTVIAAGLALAIARYTNRSRALLRTPLEAGSNATASQLNQTAEVPLVFAAAESTDGGFSTLKTFLDAAARVVEDSYTFQDFPIDRLAAHDCGFDLASAEISLSCDAIHRSAKAPSAPIHCVVTLDRSCRIDIGFDPRRVESFLVEGLATVVGDTLSRFDTLSTRVRDVPRLPADQRERVLYDWNRTGIAAPFRSAHELFEDRVAASPDAVAIRWGAETISYGELNARANRLAHHLRNTASQASESVVAIWMARSPWMVVAVFGVLKAGLAYLPIDADVPAERLEFLIKDSGEGRVLVDEANAAIAAACGAEAVVANRAVPGAETNPALPVAATNLAYVIYTSGSTGLPKGCAIEHRNLANYLRWANSFYWPAGIADAADGSMALFTPLSFDLTVPSLFCPLLRGRALTVVPQDTSTQDALAQQFAPDSGVDSVKLTPSHIRVLGTTSIPDTSVRLVIVGGEALTPEHVAIVHRIDPRIRVVNEYGPTEATVGCIAADIVTGAPILIGRPIANTQAYVLDADSAPVAIGVRGELCIGGDGVARGYLGRPELDAERFLANPFIPGGRIYRTGDLARWLPNGELECFGRIDGQVKVRGYRIEPGEIEAALRRCSGVRDAVVVAAQDELVAYVVTGSAIDLAALRHELGRTLPAYMVPSSFVGLAELPTTVNGKIDRKALPAVSTAALRLRPYVAPRNDVECAVAGIWEEVLGRSGIGVDDEFYEVGGHSLRAMAMAQRIHDTLGVDASLADILAHPTVASLAVLVGSRDRTPAQRIPRVADADHYAVSHGQRRLWLIDRIEESSPAYNVTSVFDVRGPLDREAFDLALDAVVERHESLRTIFVDVLDEPRQKILPVLHVAATHVDLRDEAHDEGRLRELVATQASMPFDLASGPLIRISIYQLEADRSVLALTVHHIVSDAWSMRVLIADLVKSYDAIRSGIDAHLPPLRIQYKDYAAWQRRALDDEGMRDQQSYWHRRLGGAMPVLNLPADFVRPPVPTYRGARISASIDAGTTRDLRALAVGGGASTFMALLAIVKSLLFRYTGEPDIRIGTPIAGRAHADTADQIGFFVNTLVLRDRVSSAETFTDLLSRVKQTAQGAYAHQDYPFDRLVEELGIDRDLSRSPLFDVMVVHESDPGETREAGGLTVTDLNVDSGISKFDLTFAFAETPDTIDVEIEYRTDLFAEQRVRAMLNQLIRLARQIASSPATPIGQLDVAAVAGAAIASPAPAARTPPQVSVAPRDSRELLLVGVIESVLGRASIGVTDNFFHIGGDSIKAIQIVNRLGRRGWTLRVRDLFEAPEIGDLAARLAPARPGSRDGRGDDAVAGEDVPLTPIERWFFHTQPEGRAHFNQSVMLRFPHRVDEHALRVTGRAMTTQHAALRLAFHFSGDDIRQTYGAPYDPVEVHDLSADPDPAASLSQWSAAAQAGFTLESGRLAKIVLFRLPDDDRLLAVIHHLAVDGVSWRILLDDLRAGLSEPAVEPAPATDSYGAWSRALAASARNAAGEVDWWRDVDATAPVALPYDEIDRDARESDAIEQRFSLSADDTAALLSRVHHAYNTRLEDVLVAALATAARDWAGPGALKTDVESHGRDALDGNSRVDVSRTVGWFTSLYPVVIDIGAEPDPGRRLVMAKDALRRTPGRGAGYGLLRDGAPSGAAILFNFLGQFDTDLAGFTIADEGRGPEFGPSARMTHALVIGGWISEGGLHMTVRFSRRQFRDATIERFTSAYQRSLEEIIAHCRARVTRERTISDFRYSDATTGALLARIGADKVDDIYPLSPMQLGMLYHAALGASPDRGEQAPAYLETFSYAISGPIDVQVFRAVWERVIARHTALRAAFFWKEVLQPVQAIFSHVEAPWTFLDWRSLDIDAQNQRLAEFAADDRRRPLALDAPPLFRFALIRLGDESYRFYWTAHHLILDGWSTAIVIQEVMTEYQEAAGGAVPSRRPAPQFGEYIDWLRSQDRTAANAHWRAQLHDVSRPTPLPAASQGRGDIGPLATAERRLSRDCTALVERVARTHGCTLSTLTRGVWALMLAAHSGQTDVVFGVTISGRPADLPDVESIVGLFINTLPLRARVDRSAPVHTWLRRLQRENAALDQFAFSSLADIQRESGVPARAALFDSVLVFENYPVDQSIDRTSRIAVEELAAVEETNYPLTLVAAPGEELLLRMSYDTSRYERAAVGALLGEMASMFESIGRNPEQPAGALMGGASADGPSAPRHEFTVGADAMDAVRAIAEREGADAPVVVEALIAILACRYATNEDLACALGSTRISRADFAPGGDVGAVLKVLAARDGNAQPTDTSRLDLGFDVERAATSSPPRIVVRCETGRFDEAFLRRVESHFATLADGAAAQPRAPIDGLAIVSAAERAQLVDEFNRTDKDWGAERTIVDYFEEQAAAHPDRCALRLPAIGRDDRSSDDTWTYGELNARANQLAHLLVRDHGVGPDVRVGVLAERSFEMVLALMSIEKAGGAYVPLDPDYPRDLVRFMMDDCGAAVILAQDRFRHLAADRSTPVIPIDLIASQLAAERVENLPSRVAGDNLAYVIYTSGSTGRPKGAMNTHRAIANRLLWMQDAYGLTEHDRVLQKTPFSFDVSVWEFFWPLMAGAELVIAKPGGHRDAAYLVSLINDAAVTTLHFVPSMLQAFIEEPGAGECRTLRRIICSGEAVTTELLRRYLEKIDVPLHNLYGPTEAAVDVTAWPLTAADSTSAVPIGKPIANIQLYVVHDRGAAAPSGRRFQLAPLGVTGELFLGGVGVGRGYLNRDELTAEKFVDDPFGPRPGARLYRTGDLARYRDDGVVDFLGRIDHQVKLRGFRIELGEIESALLAHPAIRECVVIVREDQPGMKRLVAYVVPLAGTNTPPDLAAHLEARLASHMIPSVIVALAELPRLTNGKLDRHALPAPEERLENAARRVAPRDGIERRLVRVWEEVLGQTAIGVTDDFFERGGHSILAMKLVSAIQLEFGRSIPLAQLLSHSTIERLAVALRAGGDAGLQDWRPLVEIKRGPEGAPLFLLPGAGGNVIYFQALASQLATSRPIYGLQAVGLDGRTPPLATVEEIAAVNIAEIRRVQPAGPYLLAGHSFGGRVALEMAQQLHRHGDTVQFLGIFDTAAPTFQPAETGKGWTDAQWLTKIAQEIEEFFGITIGVTLDELMPLTLDAQLTLVTDRMQRAGAWAPGADSAQLRGYLQVYKAHTQAAFVDYGPTTTPVPIALFKALERDADLQATPKGLDALHAERAWGWDRFSLGAVAIFDVPGAHLSMLAAPHVVELARALDEALAASEGRR